MVVCFLSFEGCCGDVVVVLVVVEGVGECSFLSFSCLDAIVLVVVGHVGVVGVEQLSAIRVIELMGRAGEGEPCAHTAHFLFGLCERFSPSVGQPQLAHIDKRHGIGIRSDAATSRHRCAQVARVAGGS